MLAVLDRHHVEYVVVGGFAANVHGAVRPTKDIDVAPATTTENLARLAAACASRKPASGWTNCPTAYRSTPALRR